MSHGPHKQTPFESVVVGLADDWQKSYADLSPESQTTVRTLGIGQQLWDALNAEGRAKLAADFDARHHPATKELRKELWQLEVDKAKLLGMPVADPVNFQARRIELELFDRKFEALDAPASVEAAHPIPLKSIIEPGPSHRAGPDEVLTTDDVCDAFRDVGLNGLAWRTMLTKNRPEWLLKCRADTGKQGASPVQAIWYPLKIATALVTGKCRKAGAVPASTLDRAFRQNALLKPFAQQWLDIRNDQPSWGD